MATSNERACAPPEPLPLGRWAGVFALDARSLAAMRVGLGLVLLLNLGDLAWDLPTFFTDSGLLPRAARVQLNIEEQFTAPPHWISLHMLSGEAWFQGFLFAVSGLFALGVIVGYRTPWMLFGSWLLLISLQARNPLLLQGGDDMLRVLLFWSLFLPLGARWSLDARHGGAPASPRVCSLASAALILQLVCLYLFTALLKKHGMWRTEFTAVYYALGTDHFTTLLGRALLQFPLLLQGLTFASIALEFVGPFVLLVPWRNWRVRAAVVLSFWLFHLGIAATLRLGLFPATCLVYWLALMPGEFWENLARFARRLFPTSVVRISRAVTFKPVFLQTAHAPNPTTAQPMAISVKLLLGSLLVYVVLLNMTRLRQSIYMHLNPSPLRALGDAAALDQFWCMFSPRPFDFGGWYRVEGMLADGTRVNLFDPSLPPHVTKPALVSAMYPSLRWRKLMLNLFERDCPTHRHCVGEYFRRRWNETHPADEQLAAAEIVLMLDPIPPPRQEVLRDAPLESLVIWEWKPSHP